MPSAAPVTRLNERREILPGRRRADRATANEDSKRAFLRLVSHELRTPLNAIIGFSEVIASESYGPLGSPQYKEYAGIVRESGRELLVLVNQILELVRLESGIVDLDPAVEPLGVALAEAAAIVSGRAQARGVIVALPTADPRLSVLADPRALADMLASLLERAVAASPEGGTVSVRLRPLTSRVVIEIRDDGAGCDRRDIQRLTRPFEQGGGALSRAAASLAVGAPTESALGLPIARLLAEASGGSLRLRSSSGAGMTALLSLPRA